MLTTDLIWGILPKTLFTKAADFKKWARSSTVLTINVTARRLWPLNKRKVNCSPLDNHSFPFYSSKQKHHVHTRHQCFATGILSHSEKWQNYHTFGLFWHSWWCFVQWAKLSYKYNKYCTSNTVQKWILKVKLDNFFDLISSLWRVTWLKQCFSCWKMTPFEIFFAFGTRVLRKNEKSVTLSVLSVLIH